MKCPNCGKEIAAESQFCEFCGVKINLVAPAGEQSPNGRKVLIIFVCVVLSVGGILVYQQQHRATVVKPIHTTLGIDADSCLHPSDIGQLPSKYIILDMEGNIGTSKGVLKYDGNGDYGSYSYYLTNGVVTRNLKFFSYDGNELILKSFDKKNQYIGKFVGTISSTNEETKYKGTFTNYRGVTVPFSLKNKYKL